MSESNMRQSITKALKPLHAIAVENPVLPGTPDVNYVGGWIELKWARSWPVRPDSIVRIDHYTVQQRVFAYKRRKAGGQCWWLLQVKKEWLLLDGAVAALHVNRATRQELIDLAERYWPAGLLTEELLQFLRDTKQSPYRFTPEEFEQLRESA